MTPASSGLCSETWAWVEGNFVFHLFSSSVLKNLALFKNNAEKLKQNKAHGFGICFYIQSSHICDPKSYFSKNMICFKETVAWLCAFPLKYLFENSAVVMVWKRPSIRIQIQKNMVPSANRFQHHFKLRSICKHHCVFLWSWHSLKWMFITIRKMFLQNCVRFPQTLKQNSKFQDGVLLSM